MKKLIVAALTFAPIAASAQQLGNVEGLLRSIGRLVDIALPIVVAVALLVFFWGLVKLIFGGADKIAEGKSLMIWGLVALFVMVSVWGLVKFIGNQLGIGQGDTIIVPTVPGIGGGSGGLPATYFGNETLQQYAPQVPSSQGTQFQPLEPRRGSVTQPTF